MTETVLAEGKTKKIIRRSDDPNPNFVYITSKDDITAGDGAKHDIIDPANAAMAALEILAMRNPLIYMNLRVKLEERLVNMISL